MSEQGFRGVPGVPEGWELVEVRPISEDWTIGTDGKPMFYKGGLTTTWWPIIRKIEKPKTYRPFANAAEFEPHRNRWVSRNIHGAFRATGYNDSGIWSSMEIFLSYEEMFNDGRVFDDGTPFGVKVEE